MREDITPRPSAADESQNIWVVRPDPDLADLIPEFLTNRKNELVEIESAHHRNDFAAIRRTAHTWKGICRPYGFVHLETLSKSLETAAERESASEVGQIVGDMREYLEKVRVVYDH